MISLQRRKGQRPLLIGHRGAAHLAHENTLRSFRAAAAAGVDLIEFDVLDLPRGPLVVAHSNRLDELSHGAAAGRASDHTLEELRELAPELPTFDEALAFFVDEEPGLGLHIDLKLRRRLDELAVAISRHGLASRSVVSSSHVPSLRRVARDAPAVQVGLTYPQDRLSVSRRPLLHPLVTLSLSSLRASLPLRVGRMIRRAEASALMLQHRLVTVAAVERAHADGAAVLAWTVDDPAEIRRVIQAGVDGVITNDPRIFLATLES